jgi:hypothetical protein
MRQSRNPETMHVPTIRCRPFANGNPGRKGSGIVSYFEWLAEYRPEIYAALLGRVLPSIMQQEGGGATEVVSAADIEKDFRERGLPPLQKTFIDRLLRESHRGD